MPLGSVLAKLGLLLSSLTQFGSEASKAEIVSSSFWNSRLSKENVQGAFKATQRQEKEEAD